MGLTQWYRLLEPTFVPHSYKAHTYDLHWGEIDALLDILRMRKCKVSLD